MVKPSQQISQCHSQPFPSVSFSATDTLFKQYPALYWAIVNNDHCRFMQFCEQQPELLATLLFAVVEMEKPELLSSLLHLDINTNIINEDNLSPLDLSVLRSNVTCTRLLLASGAKFNCRSHFSHKDKRRTWHSASWYHYRLSIATNDAFRECIQQLLIHDKWLYMMCVVDAIHQHDLEWLSLLLEQSPSPNQTDFLGNTPLHIATKLKREQSMSLLLAKGAYPNIPNDDGQTPLDIAIENQSSQATILLISHDAKVESRHIQLACRHGNLPILKTLIAADISFTPLALRASARYGQCHCLQFLLQTFCQLKLSKRMLVTAQTEASTLRHKNAEALIASFL